MTLLLDAQAYKIERAVKDPGARVGPGGRVWVYFAGHAAIEPNGSRRLLLGGAAATDPEAFARFAVAVCLCRAPRSCPDARTHDAPRNRHMTTDR